MRRLAICFLLIAACATTTVEHHVGFRVVDLYDKVRSFLPGDHVLGRPLRIRLWYPALSGGTSMTMQDYHAVRPMAGVPEEIWSAMTALAQRELTLPDRAVTATLNASPARERFPLVLYAPAAGESFQESVTVSEHLAARGFVVALVPRLGPDPSRIESPGLELLAEDLRFVGRQLRGLADVDETRVVIVARESDLPAAERARELDPAISAVVVQRDRLRSLVRSLNAL